MLTWHGAIMSDANSLETVADFVRTSIGEIDTFVNAIAGHEDETRIAGYADLDVHWTSGACGDQDGLEDLSLQRRIVKGRVAPHGWTTTPRTATTLLSSDGLAAMEPLTIRGLVSLAPSVVCFDRIFHHQHPNVDDARINESLGTEVLVPVSLPFRNAERSPSAQPPPQQ
jgi:hypothetical protein